MIAVNMHLNMNPIDSTILEWDEQKVLAELAQLKKDAGIENATVSLEFKDSKDTLFCAVCRQVANSKCQSCVGVAYCSREHQKAHWKDHRPYCVLHEVVEDSINGSYLVAKHGIKKGEAIFTEKPYLVMPYIPEENFDLLKFQPLSAENQNVVPMGKYSIEEYIVNHAPFPNVCLSCNLHLSTNHAYCADCGWPTCGNCDDQLHIDFECGYFKSKHIIYGECLKAAVILPKFFGVIRALLLRRKEPEKWNAIRNNASNKIWTEKVMKDVKLRMNIEYYFITLKQIFKFDDVTFSEVIDILAVFRVAPYYGLMCNSAGERMRECSTIYSSASMIRQRCNSNVICIQTYPTSIHVVAGTAIKKGEILYRSFNLNGQILPAIQRQLVSLDLTDKVCDCSFCTNPDDKDEETLAAILCLKCKRRGLEKYMTPVSTQELYSPWKCKKCGAIKTYAQADKLFVDAQRDLHCGVEPENSYAIERRLKLVLHNYKRNSPLHCGHWLILSAEYDVIYLMMLRLQYLSLEETESLLQLISTRIKMFGKFYPEMHCSLVALKMRMAYAILHRSTRIPARGEVDVVKVLTELQQIYDDIAKSFVEQSKQNVLQSYLLTSLRNLRRVIQEVGRSPNHQRQFKRSLTLPSKHQV
ncbi:unnamed protein product [Orchesella dallaii]|uniref:MYND-type domain-containing protein n=1 Tax=Orchesella dallaii TaxID=48710 RepID=A0ABP1QKM0_9HEXA